MAKENGNLPLHGGKGTGEHVDTRRGDGKKCLKENSRSKREKQRLPDPE
jgi:hypothetical protein